MGFRARRIQRQPEGGPHFGSAVCIETLHEPPRVTHVDGISSNALVVKGPRRRVEFDNVESIVGGETVERALERLLRLGDRIAVHRPRRVHDEDQFTRHRYHRVLRGVGRHDHEQEMRLAGDGLPEHQCPWPRRRQRPPEQLEVVVHRNGIVGQRYRVATLYLRHVHGVITARDDFERQAGIDAGSQRDPVIDRRRHLRRRNERGIGYPRRIGRPAAALPVGKRRTRYVTRRQCHGEAYGECAVVVAQVFEVLDLDGDPFPWRDIRHGRRKQVRALLFDEAGFFALVAGALVLFLRLFLLAYFAFDITLTDVQPHPVDGSLVRQRKHVDTLGPLVAVVKEFLPHRDAGNEAADVHRDVGIHARRDRKAGLHFQKQGPGLYVSRR